MSNDLRDRVVVITGASSGIGAATARLCGACGMRVALAARRVELLEPLAREIAAAGGTALVVPTDVADPDAIEAMVRATEAEWGGIDILLANAGAGYSARMTEITEEQILRTINTNLLGVIRCSRAVIPGMVARGRGHIITVSSVAAGFVMPRAAVYAATKAGIHAFAQGLRRELAASGIAITDVMPGVIDTPMTAYIQDMPKAPVDSVARLLLDVMKRPQRSVVTPAWYRLVLALNRNCPGLVDAILERKLRRRGRPGGGALPV